MRQVGMSGMRALAQLLGDHTGARVGVSDLQVVAQGASGRCIVRSSHPACQGIIGIYWTAEREDNGAFLPAADGLRRAGVPVPEVYARADYGGGRGACLVQDLGERSLLSMKGAAESELGKAYRAALRSVHALHEVQPDWDLQPPFDAALYRWEQDYFAEHLLGTHLHRPAAVGFSERSESRELAQWLAGQERSAVHGDFQSQYIIMCGTEAYLIDFQGMRYGLPEYDLASLLYDPYMEVSAELRGELLNDALTLYGGRINGERLQACSLQRLMQALGAYANIGYHRGNAWYLELIPTGIRILSEVCAAISSDAPAAPMAACIQNALFSH